MRRNLLSAVILCVLFFVIAAPVALAQEPEGDRVVVGEDFVLQSGEVVRSNLAVLGGNADLRPGSRVNGDVAVMGGNLTVSGRVTGNVVVFGGNVSLQEGAEIEGSLAAIGGGVDRASGAVVRGDYFSGVPALKFLNPERSGALPLPPGRESTDRWDLASLLCWPLGALGWGLAVSVVAAALMLLAPRGVTRVADAAAAVPAMSFLVGLLTMLVAVLAGFILLIACCLGLVVWLIAAAAVLFGWTAVGLWLGRALARALRLNGVSLLLAAVMGVFVITFLSRLPFGLGGIFGVIAASIGLGSVLLTRFGTRPYPHRELDSEADILPEAWNDPDL